MLRLPLIAGVLVATAVPASAECPTKVRDLPATGFLASAIREELAEINGAPVETEDLPAVEANIGVAGGVRADSGEVAETGSLTGRVLAHRGTLTGCVSGDVLDVRAGSAHLAASGQVPFFITGLGLGASLDRDIRLPLSARRELLDAPVSRRAVQLTISFIDLDLVDHGDRMRILVAPTTIENAVTTQTTSTASLDRRTTRIDVDMLRFILRDPKGSGEMGVFSLEADDVDHPDGTIANGVARLSLLSLGIEREQWGLALDGGFLIDDGATDCMTTRCDRGFYLAAFRRSWQRVSVQARGERTGFIASNDELAFEDRLTTTVSLHDRSRTLATSLFTARAKGWHEERTARSVGGRVSLSQSFQHGLSALIDGEVVGSAGDLVAETDGASAAARGMVSLAWQKRATR